MKTESIRSEIDRNKVRIECPNLVGAEVPIPFLHAHIWEKLADRLMDDNAEDAAAALAAAIVPENRGFGRTALHCLLAGVAGAAMRRGKALARKHAARQCGVKIPPPIPRQSSVGLNSPHSDVHCRLRERPRI